MSRLSLLPRVAVLTCSALALPALFACLDHPLKPVEYEQEQQDNELIEISVNRDVDILFVIDDSGSMTEEQANLANNFGSFIGVLEREDVRANYRIGITTTDNGLANRCSAGQNGSSSENGNFVLSTCRSRINEFQQPPTFNNPVDARDEACNNVCDYDSIEILPTFSIKDNQTEARPWIQRQGDTTNLGAAAGPGGNVPTVTATEAFRCFGPQGITGCGFEQQLQSQFLALSRTQASDQDEYGFLRDSAILSVVHVTDEVDCSVRSSAEAIFADNKVFWANPNASSPTSAVCWNAGVSCTGGPGTYTDCQPAHKNLQGTPTANPAEAVMIPVADYVNQLQAFETQKKLYNTNAEVLVAVIGGVPTGYPTNQAEIVYQDGSAEQQNSFGIGPGCISGGGEAVPPVRLRAFAEAFQVGGARNLYSICADNYSAALEAIATAIAEQVKAPCMTECVGDDDPAAPGVQPNCNITETQPGFGDEPDVTQVVPPCILDAAAGWVLPDGASVCWGARVDQNNSTPAEADNMSDECIERGYNLEFDLFPESRDVPPGTRVSADCTLSANAATDCPNLN